MPIELNTNYIVTILFSIMLFEFEIYLRVMDTEEDNSIFLQKKRNKNPSNCFQKSLDLTSMNQVSNNRLDDSTRLDIIK